MRADRHSTSAEVVAQWKLIVGGDGVAAGRATVTGVGEAVYRADPAGGMAIGGSADTGLRPINHEMVAEPGAVEISGYPIELSPFPEVLIGMALVEAGDRTDEGRIILAVTPAWRRVLTELKTDSNALSHLDWRQMEELIAGAYREDGWQVTLTPRSGDKGRDVIARRDDFGAILVPDQVKTYRPSHLVTAEEVHAMYGVLSFQRNASKAVITTTSGFAPGVYSDFAPLMPTRLELRPGKQLIEWLTRIHWRHT